MIKEIGYVLMLLGVCTIVATLPPLYGSFGREAALLNAYKKAVTENLEPTLDQKGAYSDSLARRYGKIAVILGVVIWFIGFLAEKI